uniref:F-box only protein 28-like isoform X1 n=1 Tax=Myxine glutinosa TaxID=7769 RepID=UPI00358FE2FD
MEQDNPFLQLPVVPMDHIFKFFSYEEISSLRRVSRKMDLACQQALNQGFIKVERFHAMCQKQVKAQLPRRESERRSHPLARHADILAAVETRLSLLTMTFMKYVDMNLCCFIPGKVVDEIYRVLRYVNSTRSPQRAHEVLQELRDISSMAMEYFDDKIVPGLKKRMIGGDLSTRVLTTTSGQRIRERCNHCVEEVPGPSSSLTTVQMFSKQSTVSLEVAKLQQQQRNNSSGLVTLRKEVGELRAKVLELQRQVQEQEQKVLEQGQVIAEQNSRLLEQERHLPEHEAKMRSEEQKVKDMAGGAPRGHSDPIVAVEMPEKEQDREMNTSSRWGRGRGQRGELRGIKRAIINTAPPVFGMLEKDAKEVEGHYGEAKAGPSKERSTRKRGQPLTMNAAVQPQQKRARTRK